MRYLFAITSPGGSDYNEWKILNDQNDFDKCLKKISEDSFLYMMKGQSTNFYCNDEEDWKYDDIAKEIHNIAKENKFAILIHSQNHGHAKKLDVSLKKECNQYEINHILIFSTANINYQRDIIPFIFATDIKRAFDTLWDKIEGKSPEDIANKAREFRAKLLTPLVALDWITQLMGSTSEHNELNTKQLVNIKDEAIEAFHNQVSEMKKSAEFQWLLKFDEYTNIEKSIQNGAVIHEELKNYAQMIEGKIEQMQ